jgi:hypothetical protein
MKRSAYSYQPQLKVDCYHIAQAPKLFVKKVDIHDIMRRWLPYHEGETLPKDDAYYVECERHGQVNWKTAKVYTSSHLIGRNNVFVAKFHPKGF